MAIDLPVVLPEMETDHDSVIGRVTEALAVVTVGLVETKVGLPVNTDQSSEVDEVVSDVEVEVEVEGSVAVPRAP